MREIIFMQVGQFGNQIGEQFWKVISNEHGIDPTGTFNNLHNQQLGINVINNIYYNEAPGGKYFPRAVLGDLEPGTLETLRSGHLGQMFNPDNFVVGQHKAGVNWAIGHNTEGAELVELMLQVVRREAERCDCLQGFQLTHSLDGGTGSGMGSLLISKIQKEYPDQIIDTFTLMPSFMPRSRHTVLMPYNATLSVHKLIEYSHMTYCIDNDALYNICSRNLKIANPVCSDLNELVSDIMSGVTSPFRFPGELNVDQRKLATNMVPFSHLHFLASGLAPLESRESMKYYVLKEQQLIKDIFNSRNATVSCDPCRGRYLTATAVFRGNMRVLDVDSLIQDMQNNREFSRFIPKPVMSLAFKKELRDVKKAAVSIYNNTAIQELFRQLSERFKCMFRRRSHLHLYTGEGVEETEFREALSKLDNLVADYQ